MSELINNLQSVGDASGMEIAMAFTVVVLGIVILGTLIAGFFFWKKDKALYMEKVWVYLVDPVSGKLRPAQTPIKAKRAITKDDKHVFVLNEPIGGRDIVAALRTYLTPHNYYIVYTQDKKIFEIQSFDNIDEERKSLGVSLSYHNTEVDMAEMYAYNRDKGLLDRDAWKKTAAKYATIIILLCFVTGFIIFGGKYYVDGKKIDADIARTELDYARIMVESQATMQETSIYMALITPQLTDLKDRGLLDNPEAIKRKAQEFYNEQQAEDEEE